MDEFGRLQAALLAREQMPRIRWQGIQDVRVYDFLNNGEMFRIPRYHNQRRIWARAGVAAPAYAEPRTQRIKVEDDVLSYSGDAHSPAGVYIAANTIHHHGNYFEIEILDVAEAGRICIGLVPDKYPLTVQPGVDAGSIGYVADDGRFLVNQGRGNFDDSHFGPACGIGDRMGVGIRQMELPGGLDRPQFSVFFTKNGLEVKSFDVPFIPTNIYPAVALHSEGEEVVLHLDAVWCPEDGMQMVVDCGEEDWVRLDDIRLNGTTLEYIGRGRTIHDVGLAQAKYPLDTTNHYFEFEIVDPGDKCYVAIGLAKHNYPMRRHPGWNQNSIAYHADDGKLFHGSGMGVRFGPKCSMGDTMGCGIFFPPDYDSEADRLSNDEDDEEKDDDDEDKDDLENHPEDALNFSDSDEEIDEGPHPVKRKAHRKGTNVTVFFTRNGKLVGHREASVPKGGFYPTIGMLSCNEKVRVDLRPLTG